MELGRYYYLDEDKCPKCGTDLTKVKLYKGQIADKSTFVSDSFRGKQVTSVTSYSGMYPVHAAYCKNCRQIDQKQNIDVFDNANKRSRKAAIIEMISSAVIAVLLPVLFGGKTSVIIICVLCAVVFFDGLGRNNQSKKSYLDALKEERNLVDILKGKEKDKSVVYLTSEEYNKLKK
ncbi:MAG: hypothetical protein J5696_00610 [Lachnospiraceae bacterium]|nr:hypothetical protein [Lachnospiraceae bacterium]